jgi:methyltransferase
LLAASRLVSSNGSSRGRETAIVLETRLLLAAVFIPMIIEARLAAVNERRQFARGGFEPAGDVYSIMAVAYPLAFLAMIVEGTFRGAPGAALVTAGAALFVAAKLLKWWAIAHLGSCWTFRLIVIPGGRRITSGPYRVMRHPNYLAVTGELVAVALMTGAMLTGPAVTLAFTALISRRIALEDRTLDAILPPA